MEAFFFDESGAQHTPVVGESQDCKGDGSLALCRAHCVSLESGANLGPAMRWHVQAVADAYYTAGENAGEKKVEQQQPRRYCDMRRHVETQTCSIM